MTKNKIYCLLIYCLLLVCLCFLTSVNGVEVVRYIDTGADAGGDGTTAATASGDNSHAYQSLVIWEAAEETNLVVAGNTHLVHCNRTNGGGQDVDDVIIGGWGTDATRYITVTQDDFPTDDGIIDTALYVLHNNGTDTYMCQIQEEGVRFINFQLLVTSSGTNLGYRVSNITGGDIRFQNTITKGIISGSGQCYGFSLEDLQQSITIYNSTVYGFKSSADPQMRAVFITAGTVNIYNTTIYNNGQGIERTGGTVTAINCVVINNNDDFDGVITMTYCAADDDHTGDSATNIDLDGADAADDWAAVVVDAAGGDFAVTDNSSDLYNNGNGGTPKAIFTDDIIGTSRPQGGAADGDWDIGAYELEVGVGPSLGQVIRINMSLVMVLAVYLKRQANGKTHKI